MPNKTKTTARKQNTRKTGSNPQDRARRNQQFLFLGLAVIVVISMVLALVVR